MKYIYTVLLCLFLAVTNIQADNLTQPFSLVPCPVSLVPGTGNFHFSAKTSFAVENEGQAEQVHQFTGLLTRAAGFTPRIKVDSRKGDVCLVTDVTLKSEAYKLEITAKKITIRASDLQGFYYALQSIRQLLPSAIESEQVTENVDWTVPVLTITDQPRFGYRGLLVDVARFFSPKENLLRIIDCMAMLKLNKLHLHLVDDNGWRIEIKKYPSLTEIGSCRADRPGKTFPERRNPRQGEPTVEKGFYTQDEIREIVRYAQERHIEVIPEIEMPAHSNAALAAYPLLSCPVVDKFIGVLPGLGGNHADVIFCAGNDSVFTFLQDVIDEVLELFPSRYIHLGGDEARKTNWEKCPLCQARMKTEHLANEEDLQGYFMKRMCEYVQSKGREVIGWDELTNTTIPDGTIILGWQGLGTAALKAAEFSYANIHERYLYVACVVDNPQTIDSESGQQAINGFLAIYDLTKDPKWLTAAEQAATYTESWSYMFEVPVEKDQTAKTDWPKDRSIVGQHIIAIGHSATDLGFAWSSFVYYRLYLLTGKEHYLHVARISAHNTKQSMNLGQELYPGQPEGLQQEAFQVRVSNGAGRRMNSIMEALTWNFAAHLDPMIRFKDAFGTYDLEEVEAMPKSKVEELNNRYSKYQSSDYGQDPETGIETIDENSLSAYVSGDQLFLVNKGKEDISKVELTDLAGRRLWTEDMKVTDEEYTFPMHGTFSGFYILNVCLVSGEQKAFKVYKNK